MCVSCWLVATARAHKVAMVRADRAARHEFREPGRRPSGAFMGGAGFDCGWLPVRRGSVDMSVLAVGS